MNLRGKTYTLYGDDRGSDQYYSLIREVTDAFLEQCPDEKRLLHQIQKASKGSSLIRRLKGSQIDKPLIAYIKKVVKERLSVYTTGVQKHLKTLPLSKRFDETLKTKEYQYHLYLVEIELANRIYREAFKKSDYKFSLIAHCLRDFRPECTSVSGDYESICRGCTEDCFVHLGSVLLKKFGIHPYISVSMDLERLFKEIKDDHQSVGALGIACVPELVAGMRLCIKLAIPAIGIPLDANRCARWMKKTAESSFNLKELEELIK